MTLEYFRLRKAAFLIAVMCIPQGLAQTPPSLEELLQQEVKADVASVEVSTSARSIKSVRNSPQATYILSEDDILTFNLKTLAEILNFLPGLYTSTDSSFDYLTVRGVGRPGDYNSRILFLVDGTRVNDNVYDAGLISDEFYIDTELIERVEYSPGAGSALYGNNAFLGVVNVITKRSNKLRGIELSLSADNLYQQRVRASYGMRTDQGHEAWLSYSHRRQDKIDIANADSRPIFQPFSDTNEDSSDKLAATYRYKQLQLQAAAVRRTRQEPGLLLQAQSTVQLTESLSENYFVSLQHNADLTENLSRHINLSTNQVSFRILTPFELFPEVNANYLFAVKGKWTNADLRFQYAGFDAHQLLFGVDGQRDHHQRYELSVVDVGQINSASGSNQRLGLYFQDEWRLSAHHLAVAGFRYDYTESGISEISPKLSWIWQPTSSSTLKLSYGTAFRAANEYESETNRFFQLAEPKSEKVDTTELIWNAQPEPHFSYYASLYYAHISNMITSREGSGSFIDFFNDKEVDSYGLETGLDYLWSFGGRLNLAVSFQQAEYEDGTDLSNAPRHLFKAMYSQPLPWRGWQLNLHTIAAGARANSADDLPGYARHDISLQWQPALSVDVVFGIKNLTNKVYTDAPRPSATEYYQPGRQVALSLRWRLSQ